MRDNLENTDSQRVPEEHKIEKQKLLYDLAYKQWENYYREIPESLRDRSAKLIAPVTAAFVFIPTLIDKIIKSNLPSSGIYLLSFISAIAILLLICSVKFFSEILNTKEFFAPTPSELRDVVEDEDMTLEVAYRNVVNHLLDSAKDNKPLAKSMAKKYKWAFNCFLIAVVIGITLYIVLSQLPL